MSHLPLENNYFSIMHLNIRSIPRHLNEFTLFLETIKFSFSVIGISETWFNESTVDVYNIDGYQSVHKYRHYRIVLEEEFLFSSKMVFSICREKT